MCIFRSYVELFQKYKSHVKARAHLDKIQHSRNERAARNFERNSQAYSNVSELRVTAPFSHVFLVFFFSCSLLLYTTDVSQ